MICPNCHNKIEIISSYGEIGIGCKQGDGFSATPFGCGWEITLEENSPLRKEIEHFIQNLPQELLVRKTV